MKILILKLGILVFTFSFLIGALRDIPIFTVVCRSFSAFLAVEVVLVVMAVIIIKVTEQLRFEGREEEEEYGEEIE